MRWRLIIMIFHRDRNRLENINGENGSIACMRVTVCRLPWLLFNEINPRNIRGIEVPGSCDSVVVVPQKSANTGSSLRNSMYKERMFND